MTHGLEYACGHIWFKNQWIHHLKIGRFPPLFKCKFLILESMNLATLGLHSDLAVIRRSQY